MKRKELNELASKIADAEKRLNSSVLSPKGMQDIQTEITDLVENNHLSMEDLMILDELILEILDSK